LDDRYGTVRHSAVIIIIIIIFSSKLSERLEPIELAINKTAKRKT